MKRMIIIVAGITSLLLGGCSVPEVQPTVHQSDLDAWVGVPVKALDTHSFFLTLPLERSFTDDGLEIRNYVNEGIISDCVTIGYNVVCRERKGGCHNIFYIRDGYVVEYRPTGSGGVECYTGEITRPQEVW